MENLIELLILAAAAYGVKSYFFTPAAEPSRELFPSRVAVAVKTLGNKGTGSPVETGVVPASNRIGGPVVEISQDPVEVASVAASEIRVVQEALVAEATPASVAGQNADMPSDAVLSEVPEDSVLKRHYFAELAAQRHALSHPYPTDSVLRRHYRQRQSVLLEIDSPLVETTAVNPSSASVHEPILEAESKRVLPEDAVLKRHRLAMIRHEIENQYPACPSDAVLRRHYHQLIQAQIDRYLAASERA